MLAGIDWRWETYPEYLDVVDALPKGINYAVVHDLPAGAKRFKQTAQGIPATVCERRSAAPGQRTHRRDTGPIAARIALAALNATRNRPGSALGPIVLVGPKCRRFPTYVPVARV